MDFSVLIDGLTSFFKENLIITAATAILLIYLLFRKTKLFLTIVLIVSVLAAALYVISYVSSIGSSFKKEMINKDRPYNKE